MTKEIQAIIEKSETVSRADYEALKAKLDLYASRVDAFVGGTYTEVLFERDELKAERDTLYARLVQRHIVGKAYEISAASINALAGECESLKADRDRLRDWIIEIKKWCDGGGEVARLIDEALASRSPKPLEESE